MASTHIRVNGFSTGRTDRVRKIGLGMHGDILFNLPPFSRFIPDFLTAGADGQQTSEHFVFGLERFLLAEGFFEVQQQFVPFLLDRVLAGDISHDAKELGFSINVHCFQKGE